MEIILIRHTAVDVPPGICYGQTDVPLRDTFLQEAEITRKSLESHLTDREKLDRVYTSPLSRCVRLAEYCGYPEAKRDDRIKEMNFGEWEMQSFEQIEDPRLNEWYDDYLNVTATKGESFMMQYRRVSDFLDDMKRSCDSQIAVFTHAGVIICAQVYAGIITVKEVFQSIPSYGEIIRIRI